MVAGGSAAQPAAVPVAGDSALMRLPVRYAVTALVVAVYMAIGFAFDLSADAYLMLSVPAVVIVQLFVHRLPLQAVWLRAAPPFRLDASGIGIAVLLAITPVVLGVRALRDEEWTTGVFHLLGVGGAVAGAYALRAFRQTTLRQLLLCIATAGVIGIGVTVLLEAANDARMHRALLTRAGDITGIQSFLFYVPIVFMVEEVFFRGTLDSYLHQPGEGTGWASAVFVSALWGTWHLPIFWSDGGLEVLPELVIFQTLVGVPLSIWWRRSGNLGVSGITHALIDSVRNAVGGSG